MPTIISSIFKRSSATAQSPATISQLNDLNDRRYLATFGELRTSLHEDKIPSRFPISQLSLDLLAEIFHWYILTVYQYRSRHSQNLPTPYCWLILGHICRAWRAVTLDNPRLSTYICMTRAECVQEMLERSRNLPIHISHTSQPKSPPPEMLKLVFAHLSRLGSMTLETSDPTSLNIPEAMQLGVGKLQSLTLILWYSRSANRSYPSAPIFPRMTFPNIFDLTWSYGNLSGIRTLLHPGLQCLSLHELSRVSLVDLLAVLEPLQDLEELVLHDTLIEATAADEAFMPQKTIILPRLRQLTISDGMSNSGILILNSLIYPGATAATLVLPGAPMLLHTFISPIVVEKLAGESTLRASPLPQSIHLKVCGNGYIHLALWEDVLSCEEMKGKCTAPKAGHKFSFSMSFFAEHDWVYTFLSHIPLANIRSVYLSEITVTVNPLRLGRIITIMPLVEQLGLECRCLNKETNQCKDTYEHADGPIDEELEPLFPRLKILNVCETHDFHGFPWSETVTDPISELCRVAHKLMAMRSQLDSPFRGLDISVQHRLRWPHMIHCSCGYKPE